MIRLSMAERPSMRGILKTLRLSHATLPSFFKNKPSPKTGYSESGTAAGGRNSYIELTSMGYRSELWWFRKNQECWLTDWVRGERIPGAFQ